MTDREFAQFCKDCKHDLLADYGEEADNISYYWDIAEGIIMTDPKIREYMKKRGVEKSMWKECLAEDIACAD